MRTVGLGATAALEPVLDWGAIQAGRSFPPIAFTLDDASVDAYLLATGESRPAYDPAGPALAPPLFTTLVRLVKASLGGRWPSGTLQLDHRIEMRRALRRGETLAIDARIPRAEERNGRRLFEVASSVRDAAGDVVVEQSSSQMWAGAVRTGSAADRPASSSSAVSTDRAPAGSADRGADRGRRIGPIERCWSLDALRAFGAVAGALDPIHVDPDFARTTRWGANVVQGRLAMTLAATLALERFGDAWLERGRLEVRFVRPIRVDEPVAAWGREGADGSLTVWYENGRGERVIEGTAGLSPPRRP